MVFRQKSFNFQQNARRKALRAEFKDFLAVNLDYEEFWALSRMSSYTCRPSVTTVAVLAQHEMVDLFLVVANARARMAPGIFSLVSGLFQRHSPI